MLARATPAKLARIPRSRAEFRPWRPLGFELQRRGYAARGWVLPGSSASVLHGRWPSCGVAEKARIGRDLFRSEDDPPAAKPATPLLSLRWTFRAKRACVVITDAEPDRLAPLTPPAPISGVAPQRRNCLAGHVGLELTNVGANYPFERSHRFAGIQPKLATETIRGELRGWGGAGDTQLGAGFCRDLQQAFCTDVPPSPR